MSHIIFSQSPLTKAVKIIIGIPLVTGLMLSSAFAMQTYNYNPESNDQYITEGESGTNQLMPLDNTGKPYTNDFTLNVDDISGELLNINMSVVNINDTPHFNAGNLHLNIQNSSDMNIIQALVIDRAYPTEIEFDMHVSDVTVNMRNISAYRYDGINLMHESMSGISNKVRAPSSATLRNYQITIEDSDLKGFQAIYADASTLNLESDVLLKNIKNIDRITGISALGSANADMKSTLNLQNIEMSEGSNFITGIVASAPGTQDIDYESVINLEGSTLKGTLGINNLNWGGNILQGTPHGKHHKTVAKTTLTDNDASNLTELDYIGIQDNYYPRATGRNDIFSSTHELVIDGFNKESSIQNPHLKTNIIGIQINDGLHVENRDYLNIINILNTDLSNSTVNMTGLSTGEIKSPNKALVKMNNNILISDSLIGAKSSGSPSSKITGISLPKGMYEWGFTRSLSETPETSFDVGFDLTSDIMIIGSENSLDIKGATNTPTIINSHIVGIDLPNTLGNFYPAKAAFPTKLSSTITIAGNVAFHPEATISAIHSDATAIDNFSNTTLNFSAKPIKLKSIGLFENYNFVLDPAEKGPLITAENIHLNNHETPDSTLALKRSNIAIVGIKAGRPLVEGESFVLMKATKHLESEGYESELSPKVAQQGISFLYDVSTLVKEEEKEVLAVIGQIATPIIPLDPSIPPILPDPTKPAVTVNPALKSLSEGYLAGAMLVSRGQDTLVQEAFNKTELELPGWHAFGAIKGGYNRYQSGSHINSKDLTGIAGVKFTADAFTYGGFIEGGTSDYDTHNTYAYTGKVKGDGDSKFYGFGALAKYQFTPYFYIDGSLRYGKTTNKFNADAIQNLVTGQIANYDVNSNYYGAHLRLGNNIALNASDVLNLSATYLYSHVKGKNVVIAGDPINFKSIDSNRLQLRALWERELNENSFFNAGIGYEYEFSGTAKATTYDFYDIDEPTVKGGTALLDIGYSYIPESNNRVQLDFGVEGYYGKRRGGSVSFKVNYEF